MVSTHLKNISQIGSSPQVGVKINNIWNHHLVYIACFGLIEDLKLELPELLQPSWQIFPNGRDSANKNTNEKVAS